MIRWLIGSSLKLRLVVVAIAALLLIFGFTLINEVPVDALPEFSRPYVEIQIEALGLSAQEVEAMITTPLEADMLNGCPWVEEIRSESIPGLATITLIFEKGTDVMHARQVASERLTEIFALPKVSTQFTMINPVSSAGRFMEIGLSSVELSLIEMSVLARWTIMPRLMGLPGVANVAIWGERMRQLQVQVDPERLRDEGITLMQVIKTTGNSLWASPLSFLEASTPGTGGWIDTPNQRLGVRHILPIQTAEDLAQVPIEGSQKKRLGGVATVVENHQPLIGDAIIKDAPSLMLVVEKFPWANTLEVTQDVEEAMIDLQPAIRGIKVDPTLFRPATFIELGVRNLALAVMIGAILMIIALAAFLFNWRTALIGTVAVLLSVIAAGIVLYLRSVPINMMIIAGLMLAISALIDDAIIDIDNIRRRLREARAKGDKKSTSTIIYEAVVEMRSPVIYATIIMVLAVAPIFFIEALTGAFFQPLALSYALALLVSMLVAMTVTPAMYLFLLGDNKSLQSGDTPVMGALQGIYHALFGWTTRIPRVAFISVISVMLVGSILASLLRQESLLPNFKETDLVIRLEGSSSASHPAMSRIVTLVSSELRDIPGVRNISANVGRAIMSDKRTNINAGELGISIDPRADYEATVAAVKKTVAGYPGISPEVLTYLQAKIREELTGTGESLIVRVYGENMDMISTKAEEVQQKLATIDGVVNAKVQYPEQMPTLEIEVDIEKAKRYHLKPGDVRRSATSLVSGIVVGSLFEEQKVFDVVVWGTPESRHSINSVQNLLIDTPDGGHVRLKEVADVRIVPSATVINRDAVARRIDVTANVHGRGISAVAADIQQAIGQINFPLEYRAELLGEYAEAHAARQRVIVFAIAALIGIFLLLQVTFRSWRLATIFFLTLPTTLVGGVVSILLIKGGLLSLGSVVGFFAVFGIAARMSITLISRYRHLEEHGGESFGPEMIANVTRERSAPILMTVVTTALAFLPLGLFGSIAGLEILYPMTIVVLGGLVTTTFFTLVGVPVIYLLFGAAREPELGLAPTDIVLET